LITLPSPALGVVTTPTDPLLSVAPPEGTATIPEMSDFTELMQQELDLREAIRGILVGLNWPHSAEIDRTLREQLVQLSTNIEVLNQRYLVPVSVDGRRERQETASTNSSSESISLDALIAQYRNVLGTIGSLIMQGSDRERGKIILTQVARSHEEMVTVLTTFRPDQSLQSSMENAPSVNLSRGEARWENEGGAPETVESAAVASSK
jgi:hypothetical protein